MQGVLQRLGRYHASTGGREQRIDQISAGFGIVHGSREAT
jgi:hypothetical protein